MLKMLLLTTLLLSSCTLLDKTLQYLPDEEDENEVIHEGFMECDPSHEYYDPKRCIELEREVDEYQSMD